MRTAAIYLHSAIGTPTSFESEIRAVRKSGSDAFAVEAPYSRTRSGAVARGLVSPESERELWERTADELDALVNHKLASYDFVSVFGRNLGGSVAAYWIASRKPRVHALGVAGAIPDLARFWAESPHPTALKARTQPGADLALFQSVMGSLDLSRTLKRIRRIPVLAQFGTADIWIPPAEIRKFIKRCPEVSVELLDDDHDMASADSVSSRISWLEKCLAQSEALHDSALLLVN